MQGFRFCSVLAHGELRCIQTARTRSEDQGDNVCNHLLWSCDRAGCVQGVQWFNRFMRCFCCFFVWSWKGHKDITPCLLGTVCHVHQTRSLQRVRISTCSQIRTQKAPCLNMTSASRASQVMSAEHAELQGSHEELQLGCISLWLAFCVPIHLEILVLHTWAFLGLLYRVWYPL